MDSLLKDLRFALRAMWKHPAFTAVAIITLALGIGGSTSIFTVVDAALLRGLPYKSPDGLYHLWEQTPRQDYPKREFSYPDYQDYQRNNVFEGVAAYTGANAIFSENGESESVAAPRVSANFFSVLSVDPILGRTFQPGEDKPGAPRLTILTYGFWQRRFGGDPGVIGRALTIDGQSYTAIGVLPKSFQFALRSNDLWLNYVPTDIESSRRTMHGTNLIARLKPGVTVPQAQSELTVIASRVEQENSQSHAGTTARLVPLQEEIVGKIKPILFVLLAAVGLVLLIACANVSSLLLTRSLSRRKEVAIRSALGASRWRVVRQLLTESIVLSFIGGAAGLAIAYWVVPLIVKTLPPAQLMVMPFLESLHFDTRILAFSFGLSLLTGVIFGLLPAMQSSGADLNEVLKEGGRKSQTGAGHRLRSVMVVTEIALAVVLLVGAGLMVKSLVRLLKTNIGFNADNLLTMGIVLPPSKYTQPNPVINFNDQLQQRVKALPNVVNVGMVNVLPLNGGNTLRFNIDGDPVPAQGKENEATLRMVSDTYFQTLGVPLIAGRMFDERDTIDKPGVVIIGKSIADRMFAGRDPVGKKLRYPSIQGEPDTIIGVVGDLKISGLDEAVKPTLYFPMRQSPTLSASLVTRTTGDATALGAAIRNEIRSLESDTAILNVRTMDEMIADTPASFMRRFPALLISIFAGVALLLASLGVYGVISYSVSQQTHYIGVRMALGASPANILKMVLKEGLVLALLGVGIGILAALFLMRLLSSLLFEVSTTDVETFAVVTGLLFLVALLACYVPARRATKIDPLIALRNE